jgi:DNA/RNA-binding domain of Phe-tRNA-synthetase-like protein
MRFSYSPYMQKTFPSRVTGVIAIGGIHSRADVSSAVGKLYQFADMRLATGSEGEFPEVQAWRRAFSTMGMKPTQYRCASEALLRRYRKEGSLPRLHPLVDLCNATSIAFAIPIAVFDLSCIVGDLTVRQSNGTERYATFEGNIEYPDPQEIIFADDAGNAHARRWSNRQSRLSAVGDNTTSVMIVAEALHEGATAEMERLVGDLGQALQQIFGTSPASTLLLGPDAVFLHPSRG